MNKTQIIKISSMTLGAAGALASAYSVIKDGRMLGRHKTIDELGDSYVKIYANSRSSSKKSTLLEKAKGYITQRRIDSPIYSFLVGAKNHALAYGQVLLRNSDNIVASALAIGAPLLMRKRGEGVNKNIGRLNKLAQKIPIIKNMPQICGGEKFGVLASAAGAGYLIFDVIRASLGDIWGIGKRPY